MVQERLIEEPLFKLAQMFMGLFVVFFIYLALPSWLGLATVVLSVGYMFVARSFLFLVLCFLNFSIGIAFDYYLRVQSQSFSFYYGNGVSVDYLAFVSLSLFVFFSCVDSYVRSDRSGVTIPAFIYKVSSLWYYPCFLMLVGCSLFVYVNAGSFLSDAFDLRELKKFSFLEYFSFVLLFFVLSARTKKRRVVSYFVVGFFVAALLMASYRMAAIIMALSLVYAVYNGQVIRRYYLVCGWLLLYWGLALIGYYRFGVYDVDFYNLLGYKYGGYLDNTFTGVIETALIYTSVSVGEDFISILGHLVGAILPLPGSLIPDEWIYYVRVYEVHFGRIPGGGLLAGFVIYFHYMLLPFFTVYVVFAYHGARFLDRSGGLVVLSSIMNFVLFVSVCRWWLYGPYVLFKFLGVFFVFYFINKFLFSLDARRFVL